MKYLRTLLPLALFGVLVAGCGGGGSGSSSKLGADDVAVVSGNHVTQAMFAAALAEERASLKDQGQTVPTAGSTGYASLKSDVVNLLVQQAELGIAAKKDGITVSQAEIAKQLAQLKKSQFGGSEKAYLAGIKQQGFTDEMVRGFLKENVLESKLFKQITKGATATKSEIQAYYAANLTQYQTPATRAVQEILVKNNEKLANQIYTQLSSGASFATLAKKYSKDPGSADKGGNFTATQGSDVPEFDAAVFAATAKTGELLKPVHTKQYGWFVIKPIAPITPAKTTPEAKAESSIKTQLESQKQQTIAADWAKSMAKSYCSGGKITYQTGYAPATDPCVTLKTPDQTTT
ncbi:MAG TPA: peptidylprolyl isomerase [Gaiellaceae bacterium]|jgi:parvulin-like peptidyl-prolyl isomerase|nr:peptidylprolyl isomerase [Gaiellaceae bacterium]